MFSEKQITDIRQLCQTHKLSDLKFSINTSSYEIEFFIERAEPAITIKDRVQIKAALCKILNIKEDKAHIDTLQSLEEQFAKVKNLRSILKDKVEEKTENKSGAGAACEIDPPTTHKSAFTRR